MKISNVRSQNWILNKHIPYLQHNQNKYLLIVELTFLNQAYELTGGRASARHLNVTFCPSALVTKRLGSSFAKCTDTVGGSVNTVRQKCAILYATIYVCAYYTLYTLLAYEHLRCLRIWARMYKINICSAV